MRFSNTGLDIDTVDRYAIDLDITCNYSFRYCLFFYVSLVSRPPTARRKSETTFSFVDDHLVHTGFCTNFVSIKWRWG